MADRDVAGGWCCVGGVRVASLLSRQVERERLKEAPCVINSPFVSFKTSFRSIALLRSSGVYCENCEAIALCPPSQLLFVANTNPWHIEALARFAS